MKQLQLLTSIAFAFMMLLSFNAEAQKFKDLDKSPMDAAYFGRGDQQMIKVYYSRPQLNGRNAKELTQKDEVWRTGANEATELVLNTDMKLGETTIKAGTYSLYTMPSDEQWTIIVSSDLNNWGAAGYKEEHTVAKLSVPVTEGKESLEAFSIAFEKSDAGADMHMGWGTLRVAVPFAK